PLRYDVVRRLKDEVPQWPIVLNGGIRTTAAALEALTWSDGVMLGREAYHRPIVLAELERASYSAPTATHESPPDDAWHADMHALIIERMMGYASHELARGTRLSSITRHMLGLYAGRPGAREYRRILSEGARDPSAGPELLERASLVAESSGGSSVL